jgi:hypothetical protein
VEPKRQGYKLNEYGQEAYESFLSTDYGGCNCHSHPPCASCTDPGNPINVLETDEFWDPVEVDPNMFYF